MGFNIGQMILDLAGGILSLAQLALEAIVLKDSSIVTGNFLSDLRVSYHVAIGKRRSVKNVMLQIQDLGSMMHICTVLLRLPHRSYCLVPKESSIAKH